MPFHELIIDSSNPATYAAYGSSELPKIGNKRTYTDTKNNEYVRQLLLKRGTTVTKFNDSKKYKIDKPVPKSTPKEPEKAVKREEISGTASKDSSKSLALKVGRELTLSLTPVNPRKVPSSVKKSSPYLNEYLKSLQKNRTRDVTVRGKDHLDAKKNNLTKTKKELSDPYKCPEKKKIEAPKYVQGRTKTLPERKRTLPSRLQAGDIYYVDYVPYVDVETDSSLSNYEESDMSSDEF